jgi:hypothetical protein
VDGRSIAGAGVRGIPPGPVGRRGREGRRASARSALAVCCGMLLPWVWGCASPDTPPELDLPLPEATRGFLQPDSGRLTVLHPSVAYRYLWSPRGPWAVHLIQAAVDDRCELGFDVLRAAPREEGRPGRETVSGMVHRSEAGVLAAVNADFFTAEGRALGTEIVGGNVMSRAARPTFSWSPGAEPWMGVARVEGEAVHVGRPVPMAGGDGATEAVGGFPDLIDAGRRVGDLEVGARPTFAAARHPRSAVGYDADRGVVWLVVVDGRQAPHSTGMSLPELAELFESLGVDEALNLDGGGSTALVVGQEPVNRPSDPTGERAVVNALALVRDPARCGVGSR